jgi:hypothetical protein
MSYETTIESMSADVSCLSPVYPDEIRMYLSCFELVPSLS